MLTPPVEAHKLEGPGILDEDHVRNIFDDGGQERLIVSRFFRGPFTFRNVSIDAAVSSEYAGTIEHGHSSTFKDDGAAIFMQIDGLNGAKRLPSRHNGAKQASVATGLFRRHQIERCFAKDFLRLISQDVANVWAAVGENRLLIDFPDPIARRFQQAANPLLTFLQSQLRVVETLRATLATSLFPRWFCAQGRKQWPC